MPTVTVVHVESDVVHGTVGEPVAGEPGGHPPFASPGSRGLAHRGDVYG